MVWLGYSSGQEAHTLSSGDVLILMSSMTLKAPFSNNNGGGNLGIQR